MFSTFLPNGLLFQSVLERSNNLSFLFSACVIKKIGVYSASSTVFLLRFFMILDSVLKSTDQYIERRVTIFFLQISIMDT